MAETLGWSYRLKLWLGADLKPKKKNTWKRRRGEVTDKVTMKWFFPEWGKALGASKGRRTCAGHEDGKGANRRTDWRGRTLQSFGLKEKEEKKEKKKKKRRTLKDEPSNIMVNCSTAWNTKTFLDQKLWKCQTKTTTATSRQRLRALWQLWGSSSSLVGFVMFCRSSHVWPSNVWCSQIVIFLFFWGGLFNYIFFWLVRV